MTNTPPLADSRDDVLTDDGEALTRVEAELLELYESMSKENQAALTRIAQFLEAHPQDEPITKEKLKELFLSAKNLQ